MSKPASIDVTALLAALRLGRLRRPGAAGELDGFDILELGCPDLAPHLLALGAARVTSYDQDAAPANFDVIVFAGGLEHEAEPRQLLRKLAAQLKPGGTLVLECGVFNDSGPSGAWRLVHSSAGRRRYPMKHYLLGEILRDYAARFVGKGLSTAGDAIPRAVFHCVARQPVAILLTGPANGGKSVLSREFMGKRVPVYTTDELFGRLLMGPSHNIPAELQGLRAQGFTPHNLDGASRFIDTTGLAAALAGIIVAECPFETNMFVIEGEALKHASIQSAVQQLLEQRGAIVWRLSKLKPMLDM